MKATNNNNEDFAQHPPISLDNLPEQLEKKQSAIVTSDSLFKLENLPLIQEKTRSDLAKLLVKGFVVTMAGIFFIILFDKVYYIFSSDTAKEKLKDQQTGTKDLVSLVLTAQSSLVGAAIGFYFGTRDSK